MTPSHQVRAGAPCPRLRVAGDCDLFRDGHPRPLHERRRQCRPIVEKATRTGFPLLAPVVPLGVGPRRLDELGVGQQRGQVLGRRAGVVDIALATAEDERRQSAAPRASPSGTPGTSSSPHGQYASIQRSIVSTNSCGSWSRNRCRLSGIALDAPRPTPAVLRPLPCRRSRRRIETAAVVDAEAHQAVRRR